MDLVAYISWSVSPKIFSAGGLSIRWYGVMFGLTFLVGILVMRWIFLQEGKPERDLTTLLILMMVGTVVGTRLGHCLFYHPAHYLSHPLDLLKVWKGGLASHGGAVGIGIAMWFYTRKRPEQPFLWLMDRLSIPIAIAACFVRIGNLFNSEILGTPTTVPWAFVFTRFDLQPRHPVQIYEAAAYAVILAVLVAVYRKWRARLPRGLMLGIMLTGIFVARFILEFYKRRTGDYGQQWSLSIGQLLSIPLILLGLASLVRAFVWVRSTSTDDSPSQEMTTLR